jgi:heat shock protein HspQ
MKNRSAKFQIGQIVRHRHYDFRGVVFDVDPEFSNSEEWWESIPEDIRPSKEQPFYHLLAQNDELDYVAYVSEQNLIDDTDGGPVRHPDLDDFFAIQDDGRYQLRDMQIN